MEDALASLNEKAISQLDFFATNQLAIAPIVSASRYSILTAKADLRAFSDRKFNFCNSGGDTLCSHRRGVWACFKQKGLKLMRYHRGSIGFVAAIDALDPKELLPLRQTGAQPFVKCPFFPLGPFNSESSAL